jgi:translation elongation factor P/translation initiation factor 5A
MTASELRIGNYVSYGGEIVRVTGVDTEYVYIDRITFDYLQHDEVEPVELTEEIIEHIYGEVAECFYVKDKDGVYFSMSFPEYVHQHQNLCFALTGEELTIKI